MKRCRFGARGAFLVAWVLVAATLAALPPTVSAEEGDGAAPPRAFETPDALVDEMARAAQANDDAALKALAGSSDADLVQPGGDPAVAKVRATFAAKIAQFRKFEDNPDGSKTLVIGDNRWPFPVPLKRGENGWYLDSAAGREEMLARRIGFNELAAIKLCRGFVRVQEEYRSKDRDGDGVREYAQKFRSTPGQKDGLWWETGEDGERSPLGPLVEPAKEYFRDRKAGDPFGGYYWRILTNQGPGAPGGCHGYIINGNMIAGFAMVGFPAKYDDTGVMTFLVSANGVVLQKDLGPNTPDIVQTMRGFDPDPTWTKVED